MMLLLMITDDDDAAAADDDDDDDGAAIDNASLLGPHNLKDAPHCLYAKCRSWKLFLPLEIFDHSLFLCAAAPAGRIHLLQTAALLFDPAHVSRRIWLCASHQRHPVVPVVCSPRRAQQHKSRRHIV